MHSWLILCQAGRYVIPKVVTFQSPQYHTMCIVICPEMPMEFRSLSKQTGMLWLCACVLALCLSIKRARGSSRVAHLTTNPTTLSDSTQVLLTTTQAEKSDFLPCCLPQSLGWGSPSIHVPPLPFCVLSRFSKRCYSGNLIWSMNLFYSMTCKKAPWVWTWRLSFLTAHNLTWWIVKQS